MMSSENTTIESRLRAVEDHIAICQVVAGYGYAVDGLNAEAVGSFYAEDGVYAVGDVGRYEGRAAVAGITASPPHIARVGRGCAHVSTSPYVVIEGDRAVATCHTLVMGHGPDGFYVDRLSASRIELSRTGDGGWQIDLRQNQLLNGDAAAPALLARLKQGPGSH